MTTRSLECAIQIESGETILCQAFEYARQLFNHVRWIDKTRKVAGEKYAGRFGFQKLVATNEFYRSLSDRCSSGVISEFDVSMRMFFTKQQKGDKDSRPPRYAEMPRPLFFEIGRNAKHIGDWRFRLTVLGGHIAERHCFVKLIMREGVSVSELKTLRIMPALVRGGGYKAFATRSFDLTSLDELAQLDGYGSLAALDLGIINLGALTIDDGTQVLYSGRALLDVLRYDAMRAAQCRGSNWRKGLKQEKVSEHQKTILQHTTNVTRLAVHNFTTHVIRTCVEHGVGILAIGDLTGIRENKDFGKRGNRKFHRWPFLKIKEQLVYKGEEYGIKVVTQSEAYTSQTCSGCGRRNKNARITRGLYQCNECGLVINADVNGSRNQLKRISKSLTTQRVVGDFPAQPSPTALENTSYPLGLGEVFANQPLLLADFDLRNFAVKVG